LLYKYFPEKLNRLSILQKLFDSQADKFINSSKQLIHGDFIPDNLLLNESTLSVVDFDFCGYGNIHYDIASFIWALRLVNKGKLLTSFESNFLSGYEAKSKTQVDKQLIEFLIILRDFWVWSTNVSEGSNFRRLADQSFNHFYDRVLQELEGTL